jgi:activating signal cointegrator 1
MKEIKAITLWQPWASLIATGAKTWETRSWPTSYRGPLAIHASKRWGSDQQFSMSNWDFQGGLAPLVGKPLDLSGRSWSGVGVTVDHLPFGAVIAVCRLVDCVRTDSLTQAQIGTDRPFGDYSPGRYAWKTDDLQVLAEPIPARGAQGLWTWKTPAAQE